MSFAPAPGWTAVVGPNGAGKSTLLRVLAGLQPADAGEVRFGDRLLAAMPARERATQIAWLAQQGEASGDLTVREVVELGRLPRLGLFGAPGADDRARVDAAMAEAGCAEWAARRLHRLSGGERQRVLLARALAVDAAWLLLDEPTTHLDPTHQLAAVRSMRRCAAAGARVVSVLHDVALALFADTLVVMQAGRLRAHGASGDPSLHAVLIDAFDGALRIERLGDRWIAVPELGER